MIYADFNATTPLCSQAVAQMNQATEFWGNPSSTHGIGRGALELLEKSRVSVAKAVGVDSKEVVFTSGGSESNTMALLGSLFLYKGNFRLITSSIEHSSVRDSIALLESQGVKVEHVQLLPSGEINLIHFSDLLRRFKPHMVSLMTANNETGILFPISDIAKLCAEAGATFHTDAVQAFGKISPSMWNSADLISISAHKIHGPKGVGALLVRNGKKLIPTHYGGSQEMKRRGGTQNMMGIAGFGGACSDLPEEKVLGAIRTVRDSFEDEIRKNLDGVSILGTTAGRLPNTSNIGFRGISSEILLGALDLDGVCVSAGSACFSGSVTPSHVLLAMGLSATEAKECVRFSWGRTTTPQEVEAAATLVIDHVKRIRDRKRARESRRG